MDLLALALATTVLQAVVVVLALRLIPITGKRTAWSVLALALLVMLVRRLVVIHHAYLKTPPVPLHFDLEVTSFFLTVLLVVGVWRISSMFREFRNSTDIIRESEARYKELFLSNPHPMWIYDLDTLRFVEVNDAMVDHYGYSREELLSMTILDIRPETEHERLRNNLKNLTSGHESTEGWIHRKKDGSLINVEISSHELVEHRDRRLRLVLANDITKHLKTETLISRLNRMYAVLSDVNQAIVRINDQSELFTAICSIATQKGGFEQALITLRDNESGKPILAAYSSPDEDQIRLSLQLWKAEHEACCPMLQTLKTGARAFHNLHGESDDRLPCRHLARERGIKSTGSFPLTLFGKVCGAITLYSTQAEFFDEDEIRLLDEMAMDISHAMEMIERDKERKKIDLALRHSEAILRETGSIAKVGGWEFDPATGKGTWSDEVARIHDFDPSEATTMEIGVGVYLPGSREKIETAIAQAIKDGTPYDLTLEMETRAGNRKWVRTIGNPMMENGRVILMRGAFQDVTEIRRAEEAIRESEQRLRLFVEHAPAAIAMMDREMRYLAVSKRWLSDYRLENVSIVGRSHYDIFPEIPERWKEIHRRCLAGAVEMCDEDPFPRLDGTTDWVKWEIRPWHTADGSVGGILLFSELVTERKKAEERIKHLSRLYATLSQINQVIVRIKQPEELYVQISNIAVEFGEFDMAWTGLLDPATGIVTPQHMSGRTIDGMEQGPFDTRNPLFADSPVARALKADSVEIIDDVRKHPATQSWRHSMDRYGFLSLAVVPFSRKKTVVGALVLFGTSASRFTEDDRKLLEEISLDISFALDAMDANEQHRSAQQALFDSEQRWSYALEGAGDGVWDWNVETGNVFYSPRLKEMLGWADEEMPNQYEAWESRVHPEDLPAVSSTLQDYLQDRTPAYSCEHRLLCKDGSYKWILDRGKIVSRTSDGKPLRMIGTHSDISDRKAIEEELKASEEKFSKVFFTSPDAITLTHMATGRYLDVNQGFVTMTGYRREDVIGKTSMEINIWADLKDRERLVQGLREKGEVQNLEATFRLNDGRTIVGLLSARPIQINGEQCLVLITRDITDRKRSEAALERYKLFSQNTRDIVFFIREHDRMIIEVNDAAVRTYGYTREELITMTVQDLRAPEAQSTIPRDMSEALIRGILFETIHRRRDGSRFPVEVSSRGTMINNEVVLLSVVRDITDRKLAEEATRASEEKFSTAFYISPDAININRLSDQTYLEVNKGFLDLTGYTREEVIGKTSVEINVWVHAEDRDRMVTELSTRGEVSNLEAPFRMKDGRIIIGLMSARLVQIHNEPCVLLMTRDITERKKAEELIRTSEEKFSNAFHISPDSININRMSDGLYLDVNQGFLAMTGYTRDEVIGKTSAEIDIWANPADRQYLVRELLSKGEVHNLEAPFRIKNGQIVYGLMSARIITVENERCILSMTRDISDRMMVQRELQESERRYRDFFDEDLTGDYISTPEGRVLACNAAFARIFGFESLEDALDFNMTSLYPSPEHRRFLIERIQQEKKLEYVEIEMRHRTGKRLHIVANIVGRFDESGRLTELKGYLFDDTKRRELEQQLLQSQKLESLGTLAGGIAHDFNNILGIIMGYVPMLENMKSNPAKFTHSIEAISKATDRGAALVKQLLTFARKSDTLFRSIQVNDVTVEIQKLLQETFPKSIVITLQAGAQLPTVNGDATQLHQVFLNLCVNARDAMPKGGRLTIATSVVDSDTLIGRFSGAIAARYVEIVVTDTGIGMEEEVRTRIFEPFFTTKGVGKGTGLGLALVFSIVRDHDGFVEVQSKPGRGTEFRIYLPAEIESIALKAASSVRAEDIPGGNERLLLVEDEELLRELVTQLLALRGYKVTTAEDGLQGLQVFRDATPAFDLVISDIGLPRMSGDELFLKIRELNPKVPVVLASGYIDPEIKTELANAGAIHFIHKPYTHAEVLTKIREVLDRST